MRKLEGRTALYSNIRARQRGVRPVVAVGHVHVGRKAALQLHGTGFHRETARIAVIAGKRPDSVLAIIVFHRQLSFPLTATFIHETAGKSARACISERGKPGRLLSLRGKITNSSTCSGTFLIDDTPRQVMTIQIEQTAFIAECERISRHGIGLELSILHQHQNGHATLQPNGGSSITIRAIQARFADVTQRATRDIAVFIIGHVILSRTAAHAKNSLVIT